MFDSKKAQGKQQVDRKTVITIVSLLSVAIIIQIASQQITLDPNELDDTVGHLAFTINISLFGIVFVILAQKDLNKYVISSFGLLFVMILPVIATIPILMNPIQNLAIFIPVYLGGILGWFFGVRKFVIGNDEGDEDKKFAKTTMKTMFRHLLLIFFGILGYYVVIMYFHNLNLNG